MPELRYCILRKDFTETESNKKIEQAKFHVKKGIKIQNSTHKLTSQKVFYV